MSDLFELGGANPWRTESSRVIFDDGRLRLREDAVIQPDGEPGRYAYLEGYFPVVVVAPVDADLNVYIVRQWRYPWRRNSWEIPAGTGEAGETPLESARRELAEETGLSASVWELLGSGYISATLDARYHLYLARGLSTLEPGAHHKDGAEHDMIAQRVPLGEAVQAAMDGRIEHAMSVVGLLRAARRLGV